MDEPVCEVCGAPWWSASVEGRIVRRFCRIHGDGHEAVGMPKMMPERDPIDTCLVCNQPEWRYITLSEGTWWLEDVMAILAKSPACCERIRFSADHSGRSVLGGVRSSCGVPFLAPGIYADESTLLGRPIDFRDDPSLAGKLLAIHGRTPGEYGSR